MGIQVTTFHTNINNSTWLSRLFSLPPFSQQLAPPQQDLQLMEPLLPTPLNAPTQTSHPCTSTPMLSRMTTPSLTSTLMRSVMVTMPWEDTRLPSLTAGPRLSHTPPPLMVMLLM